MTYAALYSSWWPIHQLRLRRNSIINMAREARAHILPTLGHMELGAITQDTLQALVLDKQAHGISARYSHGLSPASISRLFRTLRPSLRWALARGYIDTDPTQGVVLPKIRTPERLTFAPTEVERLLSSAHADWMRVMVTIAYRTGMRRGEVLGLQWRDIDLASTAPMLSVARQLLAIQDGQPVVGPPKTETSRRRIMLDAGTAGLLHSLHATQSGDWVIQCKHECPPSPNWITKVMHNACLRAEIPHRSFHSLRHTHATLLLAAGVNPKVVQERLGHAHIEMTLGIYGHVLPSMQAAAVAALDRLP